MNVTVKPAGGKKLRAEIEGLSVITDLPVEKGGENTAPSAYKTFLATIALCAGIYALEFCQHRGLPADGLEIVQHCDHDEASHRLERVRIEVNFPHGCPEKYRKALLRAVDRCRVKKTLADPPEMSVTLGTR